MLAAILICGASVFTSCTSNDDNPATPNLNVAEKIIGKWMTASVDGQALPTNDKMVYNFISTTEAYISSSFNARPDFEAQWVYLSKADVIIAGNKVTITHHPDEQQTVCQEFTITAINDNEFTANMHVKITANGNSLEADDVVRFTKVKVDYSADIIGMWEGQVTSEQDTYGDGLLHRWEYKADGTYVYYVKDGDNWVPSANTLNEYFVAGKLLCSRWINAGTELREWWEIESIENGVMKWTALREKEDGTTFTSTFEMKKVEISPIDNKCARAEVVYRIKSPKSNYTFFEGKYAVKSGNEVKEIKNLVTFVEEQNEGYNINDIAAFPVEEAICLHYGVKDGLESYAGEYSLNREISYTVTSYNAKGEALDTQTISDEYTENGNNQVKEDFESSTKLSYIELHASIAEDGKITLSKVNKMHPEKSGIDW